MSTASKNLSDFHFIFMSKSALVTVSTAESRIMPRFCAHNNKGFAGNSPFYWQERFVVVGAKAGRGAHLKFKRYEHRKEN